MEFRNYLKRSPANCSGNFHVLQKEAMTFHHSGEMNFVVLETLKF
jgi:hypothetical protein